MTGTGRTATSQQTVVFVERVHSRDASQRLGTLALLAALAAAAASAARLILASSWGDKGQMRPGADIDQMTALASSSERTPAALVQESERGGQSRAAFHSVMEADSGGTSSCCCT